MAKAVIPPPPPGFELVDGELPPPPPGFELVQPEGALEKIGRDVSSGLMRSFGNIGDLGVAGINALFALSNRIDAQPEVYRGGPPPRPKPPPLEMIGSSASDAYRSAGMDLDRERNFAGILGEFMAFPPTQMAAGPVKEGVRILTAAAGARAGQLAFPDSPAAEMVGAMSPFGLEPALSSLVRGSFRGNGSLKMQERLANMDAAGVKPTVGSASGSRRAQALEATVAALPGGHGQVKAVGLANNAILEDDVARLAGGANRDTVIAGNTIKSGLFGPNGWVNSSFRSTRDKLYGRLDAKLTPATPVPGRETYQFLTTANKGVQGAPAISAGHLVDSELKSIADDFLSDVTTAGGAIPYEALKKLRTKVGDKLADPELIGTEQRRAYSQLYAAMSKDMEEAAVAAGAGKEFSAANRYNQLGQQRMDDFFQGISDKGAQPEAVYKIAIGDAPESATKLFKIKNSLTPDEWSTVRQTVLNRMGRSKPNVQTDEYVFSAETFLTAYNNMGKNPRVLDALFGSTKSPYRQNLDIIAKAAGYQRESSKVLANPSGTAGLGLQASALFGAFGAVGNMGLAAATGAGATAAAIPGVASGIAAGTAGAYGLGKLLTNESFVRWLAQGTKLPVKSLPGHIARLSALAMNDPEFAPLIEQYKAQVEASMAGVN
jgi:hypothetical protein